MFGVHLSAIHAAWTERRRLREVGALLDAIGKWREIPHVLVGDFNTLPPGEVLDVRKLPPRPQWLSSNERPVSLLPPVNVPRRAEPAGVAADVEAESGATEKATRRRPTGQARPATA